MGFDYNISQNDVTIEKKFVEEGETEYQDVLAKTEDEAKAAADAHFTLVYKDGKGELKLADEIAAFFKRTGVTIKKVSLSLLPMDLMNILISLKKLNSCLKIRMVMKKIIVVM